MSPMLDIAGAAAYLGVTVKALRSRLERRRKAGDPIRTYRLGSSLRFKREDLDAAMTVEQPRRLRRIG